VWKRAVQKITEKRLSSVDENVEFTCTPSASLECEYTEVYLRLLLIICI